MAQGSGAYRVAGAGCLLLLAATAVGLVFLARVVPWYWMLGIMAGLAVGFWLLLRFGKLLMLLFVGRALRMKSSVLRGARVELHSSREIDEAAVREQGTVTAEEGTRFLEFDVTITPADRRGGFRAWDPWDLALTPAGAETSWRRERFRAGDEDAEDDLDIGWIIDVRDGSPVDPVDDIDKIEGAARLLLTFACGRPDSPAKLRYWFESLGPISYPWSGSGGDQ